MLIYNLCHPNDPAPLYFVELNPFECAWLKASVLPIIKCQFLLNKTVFQAWTLDQQTNKQTNSHFIYFFTPLWLSSFILCHVYVEWNPFECVWLMASVLPIMNRLFRMTFRPDERRPESPSMIICLSAIQATAFSVLSSLWPIYLASF